jgi:hypothetical protein
MQSRREITSWSSIQSRLPKRTLWDEGIGSIRNTNRARPESPLSWLLLSRKLFRYIILILTAFMWGSLCGGGDDSCAGGHLP